MLERRKIGLEHLDCDRKSMRNDSSLKPQWKLYTHI